MSKHKPFFVGNRRTKRFHIGSGLSGSCQVREMAKTHVFFDSMKEIRKAGRYSICYYCHRAKEQHTK